jgi:hypothetical protein
VVQQLRKVPLGLVFPLRIFVRYDEDVVCFKRGGELASF